MGLRTNPVSDSCDSKLHQEQHTATDSNRTTRAEKEQKTTSKDHFHQLYITVVNRKKSFIKVYNCEREKNYENGSLLEFSMFGQKKVQIVTTRLSSNFF